MSGNTDQKDILIRLKDVMMLGVSNQEAIAKLNREIQNGLGAVHTEIGQLKVRNDLEIQQSVRNEMYEQIK